MHGRLNGGFLVLGVVVGSEVVFSSFYELFPRVVKVWPLIIVQFAPRVPLLFKRNFQKNPLSAVLTYSVVNLTGNSSDLRKRRHCHLLLAIYCLHRFLCELL